MAKSNKAVWALWINRGLGICCLLLVCAIAYTLAQLTWFFLNPGAVVAVEHRLPTHAGGGEQRSGSSRGVDLPSLQGWHLFGTKGVTRVVKPKPAPRSEKVPETTLRLELEGVFSAGDEGGGSAIIAEKGKPGKLYRIGERLPGNAILEEVHEDRVLLSRSSRMEVLRFPQLKGVAVSASDAPSKARQKTGRTGSKKSGSSLSRRRDKLARSEAKSRTGKLISSARTMNPDRLLQSFTQDFNDSPEETLSDLGVDVWPASEGGGYRLSGNVPPHIIKMLGLREGDIIRSVNGHALGDIQADQGLYNELMSHSEVGVEIERGSRRYTVNVPVPKL